MTDFQAALGYFQIKRYKKNLKSKKKIAKRYIKNFKNIKSNLFMPFSNNNSYFVFQIFCKNRDKY
jgi:dTDP-4-amino-4,6-dideoxygalactose transaminase